MSAARLRRRLSASVGALLLGVLVLWLALAPRRARASSELDAADRSYAEGHYTQAAAQYEALISQRGYSAPVLVDLGNAYVRADRPVDAILAYERARLLSPRDPAIVANLAVARKAAGVPDDDTMTERFERLLSADQWTWLAAGAFWLTVSAGAAAVLFRRRRGALVATACAAALAASIAATGVTVWTRVLHEGLVTTAAPAVVSPFATAQSSFSLGPGAPVELGAIHDGYVLVRARDGRSGWVELRAVAPLVPD